MPGFVPAVVVALLFGQATPATAQPAKIEPGAVTHFDAWLEAIERHSAGSKDAALQTMLRLTADQLESVFPYMVYTLRGALVMQKRPARFDELFSRYGTRGHQPPDLDGLQERIDRVLTAGIDPFLKRAAMLHSDIAVASPTAHRSTNAGIGHVIHDGRGIADEGRPWHWMVGRSFLHLVQAADSDPYVRLWYQAVGNHLLGIRNLTEAKPHLDRAIEVFPRDAEIQFLRGFMHEAQAGAELQAAMAERLAAIAPRQRASYQPVVSSESAEQADALEAFAKAVELNPGHDEARVRFGRALTLDGKADRAVTELRAALSTVENATLKYLAQLFLGRAEESRGRIAEARAAYEAAAAVFPGAQSARLALSQLELQAGNPEGARALFPFLGERHDGEDPWWSYFYRSVTDRFVWMRRLWALFAQDLK